MKQGCLALFALPFAAVGVGMTLVIGSTLLEARRMASWPQVPARILETNLEHHRGSKGGTTYKVAARYQYSAGGVEREEREGTRVGMHSGSDNIGSYQQDMYRTLSQAKSAGRTVPCFVNPADPGQAILDPHPRPGLLAFQALFGVLFGGVGFGMLAAAFAGAKSGRGSRAKQAAAPAEPWRWREDWNTGVLKAGEGAAAKALVFFAGFWNLIAWGAMTGALLDAHRSTGLLVLGLFPLTGLGLGWGALVAMRRWRRFGASTLHLAATPIPPGGELVAGLRLPENLREKRAVTFKLACVRTETRGSGKNRKTVTTELWSSQQVVEGEPTRDGRGMLVPVRFQLPAGQPPSDPEQSGDRIGWRLTVTSNLAGPDLSLTFELPVFAASGGVEAAV